MGGAVRDQLLGRPVKERDWVVVGAAPDMLLGLGFRPVGKDFPVFLHPETHEEYALARTERKTGKGYTAFEFHADPAVTLEEDLKRRDLTINAIAQSLNGELIDPYGGIHDIQHKILRHVSPAFAEDPVRILRLGRFAARFADFTIAEDTIELMRQMVTAGEVDALVAERVWQEWERALGEPAPERFFETLRLCGALTKLFPELVMDTAELTALENAVKLSSDPIVRFAALFAHVTPKDTEQLCDRYRVPRTFRDVALLVSRFNADFNAITGNDAEQILVLLERTDAFRRPERFKTFLLACRACEGKASEKENILVQAYESVAAKKNHNAISEGMTGLDIAREIRLFRLAAITKSLSPHNKGLLDEFKNKKDN